MILIPVPSFVLAYHLSRVIGGHDTSVSEIDVNLFQKCTSCGSGSHVGLPGEQAISSL
jgi:hypothetical protein